MIKSIKSKLIVYFCILILLITSAISILGYQEGTKGMKEIGNNNLMAKLTGDISAASVYLDKYFGEIKYNHGILLDERGNNIEGRNNMVDDILNDMGDVATIFVKDGDDFRRITTNIKDENGKRAIGTYLGKDSEAYSYMARGEQYVGQAMILERPYLTAYKPIYNKTGDTIGILFVGVSKEESDNLMSGHLNDLRNTLAFITIIGIIIALIVVYIIAKRIANPIIDLSEIIKRLSDYDLTLDKKSKAIKYLKRKDEIGIITRALANMQENFISLIRTVSDTSQQVAAASEELTATSQQSSTTSQEIARTIEEIATGASEQANHTEEGVVNINVLNRLIEKDQKNVKDLNASTKEVTRLKEEGFDILKELVENTETNIKSSKEVKEIIVDINDSTQKIESASDMIRNISEQTNLLALNAAIEAARAGESGKGFAVVAEEIRKLAEQSSEFTDEIANVVWSLTDKTEHAVETIEGVGSVVKSQTESVHMTREKFEGIDGAIEKMKNVIKNINQSGQDMKDKKDEIISIIESLSAISEENAAGTEEASAAVEEQTASMEEIANASEALGKMAEETQESISKFKY
ncbi:methyl-accepting chemotaxis protein [Dethiothermospora halolimnae]|uniref:methyl-accepting chemotaxis protein n=1 Tax=Dethiothermospora halolimnae TaxID=3114390 RepID=UPI003CCB9B38